MTLRSFPLLLFSLLCSSLLFAQADLDGAWEGTMTVGGIYSKEQLPMQLYLTTEGTQVEGRSYVQLPDGSTLRMDLRGWMYRDLSLQLTEVKFAGDPTNEILPEFNRQYQIVFKPDLWDAQLRGFWQEVTDHTFNNTRKRGRMVLKRKKVKGV